MLAFSAVNGQAEGKTLEVRNFEELQNAAADEKVSKIMLMQDIEVDKSIIINGAKNIEGVSLKAKGKIAMIRLEKNVDHFDISNIQFDGNEISSEGIGIGRNSYRKDMDIKIEDCKFEKFEGSALRLSYDSKINKADIDILNSQFKSINDNNNTKNGSSGIVEVRAIRTDLNVENSVFDNNTSSMGSAGIRVLNDDKTEKDSLGNINITGSEFKNSSTKDEVSGNGGILYSNNCNIKMTDVFIDNNSSTENGGAIFAASHGSKEKAKLILDTLNEDNNIISNNFIKERYSARGGAITLFGNIELEAYNTTFKGNKSDVDGGALNIQNQGKVVVDFENSLFENNKSKTMGGAILFFTSLIRMEDSTETDLKSNFNNTKFINNESEYGGAIYLTISKHDNKNKQKLELNLNDSLFEGNKANDSYGAVGAYEGTSLNTDNTKFINNTAKVDAGAVGIRTEEKININNTNFVGNKSENTGGALHIKGEENVYLHNTIFDSNSARNGGAMRIWVNSSDPKNITEGKLDAKKVIFKNNSSDSYGGAVYVSNNGKLSMRMEDSLFENNGSENGGGVYLYAYPSDEEKLIKTDSEYKFINTDFIKNEGNSAGAMRTLLSAENTDDQKLDVDMENCKVNNNVSKAICGSVLIGEGTKYNSKGGEFVGNSSEKCGGAIGVFTDKEVNISDTKFENNISKDGKGGAINVLRGYTESTSDNDCSKYSNLKVDNVSFINNKSNQGIFKLEKEICPKLNEMYNENFTNIKSLSKPAVLGKNIAYNNYDVSFLSNKEIEEVPDGGGSGGGGSGGGGSGGGSTTDDKKTTAILANGKKYTDVLTATVLAHEKKCPILLTDTNSISKETMDELNRRGIGQIIISGGEQSVSKNVVNQLGDFDVVRYSGHNRYETAREIARQVRLESGNTNEAVLVDGTNFPDVITVSALASQKRAPILLTETNKLNLVTENIVKEWLIDDITIAGQTKSVSENVENRIEAILKDSPKKIVRIGGHDRYETASLIGNEVRKLTGNKKDMILVDGTNFPDGITVNSLASKFECPIHLTNPNTLTDITKKDISSWKVENILVAGGNISVSDKIYKNLDVKNKERISGHSRYMTAVEISKRFDESKMLIKK